MRGVSASMQLHASFRRTRSAFSTFFNPPADTPRKGSDRGVQAEGLRWTSCRIGRRRHPKGKARSSVIAKRYRAQVTVLSPADCSLPVKCHFFVIVAVGIMSMWIAGV